MAVKPLSTQNKRYRPIKPLGHKTQLVEDLEDNQNLKVCRVLPVGDATAPDIKEACHRLRHEYRSRDCPYAIHLLDCYSDHRSICLIFEYCEGGSLHALISRAKKHGELLNEIEVFDWLVQILKTLQNLHSRNIYHCNLNTRDILLKDNTIRIREDLHLKHLTRHNSSVGSCHLLSDTTGSERFTIKDLDDHVVPYACPYLVSSDGFIERQGSFDLWSFGCILYEMVHQKQLHTCANVQSMKRFIQTFDITKLKACCYPEIQSILETLLDFEECRVKCVDDILNTPRIIEHIEEMEEFDSNNIPILSESNITVSTGPDTRNEKRTSKNRENGPIDIRRSDIQSEVNKSYPGIYSGELNQTPSLESIDAFGDFLACSSLKVDNDEELSEFI